MAASLWGNPCHSTSKGDSIEAALLVTVFAFITSLSATAPIGQKTLDIYFIDVEGGQATLVRHAPNMSRS